MGAKVAGELDRGVRWTPEQRDEVWSWRGAVNPKFEREALDEMGDVKARFAERVKQIGYDFARTLKWFEPGLGRVDPAVRPLMEKVLETARVKKMPAEPLDLDVEAGLVGLEIIAVFYSFRFWVAKEGLPFALRALARCHEYWSSGKEHLYTMAGVWLMHDTTRADEYPEYADSAWNELRAALAEADDATYAATRKVAAELRPTVPPVVRALIAQAFTEERAWANEAADEVLALAWPPWLAKGLVTVVDLDRAERLARVKKWALSEAELLTLLAREGSAAAPVIIAALETAQSNDDRKRYAGLLAMIETPEAAAALTKWLANKAVSPIATRYLKRLPDLARSEPAPAVRKHAAVSAASAKDIPAVLASPPWLAKKAATKTAEPIALATIVVPIRSAKREGDLEALAHYASWGDEVAEHDKKRSPSPSEAAWRRSMAEDKKYDRAIGLGLVYSGPEDLALAEWNALSDKRLLYYPNRWYGGAMLVGLERRGPAFVPGLLRLLRLRPSGANRMPVEEIAQVLVTFDGTDIAELFVTHYASGKKFKALADEWAQRYPETAAKAAIVHAVGAGKLAENAVAWLRTLVEHGRSDAVRSVAREYERASKKPVLAALDARVGTDPLAFFPAKLPKLPAFADPGALPPIMLEKGGALSRDAVTSLVTMLAFSTPESPYAGLGVAREACTPESLRDFAWALFEAWLATGSSPKEMWALHALGFFGDDDTVRRLTPMIRAWPTERAMARAVVGLGVLASIGTDLALMLLDGIAEKMRFASVKEAARARIEQIAKARGLTRDELSDRLVPDLGFDARGERPLTLGARKVTVRVDEQLAVHVFDGDKAVPDAKAKSPELKALKKDLASVARSRIDRLEAAMVARRRWKPEEHRLFFVDKPLVLQLSKRLVWGDYDATGKLARTFRVDADGSLSDDADKPVTLGDGHTVGVVHPLELDAATLTKWSTLFADYELLQPFAQLARTVQRPAPAEKKAASLTSQHGLKLPAPKLVFGLEKRRWQRWGASDGGSFSGHSRPFAGTPFTAHVEYSGAVGMGYIEEREQLVVETVTFTRTADKKAAPLRIDEVDPIVVSEVLGDLASLV